MAVHAMSQVPNAYGWSQRLGPVQTLWGSTSQLKASAARDKVLFHEPAHRTMHSTVTGDSEGRKGHASPTPAVKELPPGSSIPEFRDMEGEEGIGRPVA